MDQIIPILIAAVVFGFQAYANYQKEQQKARNRKLGPPPSSEGIPDEFREYTEMEARPIQDVQAPDIYTPTEPVKSPYGQFQGTLDPSLSRRSRLKKEIPIPEVVLAELDEEEAPVSGVSFDLREAVILAAILERPYKD